MEIEALVLGLAEVRLAGDAALGLAAERALAKITATLPERVQRQAIHAVQMTCRFERRAEAPAHLATIRAACWNEVAPEIGHEDREGAVTRRRVWPLAIVFLDRTLILLAFCRLRQDYRRFHLHRISGVYVLDESFRPRRVAMLRDFTQRLRGEGRG
jgi:predicted DNA-binding transcriptional regulator YafY